MLMRENLKHSVTRASRDEPLQEVSGGGFTCGECRRSYKLKSSLRNHRKWECGKEPQFKCPYCNYKAKQKMHMARHLERMHRSIDYSSVNIKMDNRMKNEVEYDNNAKQNVFCSALLLKRKQK
ncbi:unnamed protein product [Phaedon cochleariae]|uniref:C2H2-type domain-containing protein n=1 Tax=Phaedon cochleariae TaxID=80249 RepID=A0A9N9SDA9_PHACE|nr:unnamed protein product [Phaedon cochleariae]